MLWAICPCPQDPAVCFTLGIVTEDHRGSEPWILLLELAARWHDKQQRQALHAQRRRVQFSRQAQLPYSNEKAATKWFVNRASATRENKHRQRPWERVFHKAKIHRTFTLQTQFHGEQSLVCFLSLFFLSPSRQLYLKALIKP